MTKRYVRTVQRIKTYLLENLSRTTKSNLNLRYKYRIDNTGNHFSSIFYRNRYVCVPDATGQIVDSKSLPEYCPLSKNLGEMGIRSKYGFLSFTACLATKRFGGL